MANNTSYKGFKPMKRADGAALSAAINPYRILDNYSTSIFTYDLVTLDTNGTITQCTATGLPVGIFMGVQYTDSAGIVWKRPYWPASTRLLAAGTVEAYVCDDPNIIFEAQFDATTTTAVQANVGGIYDIVVGTGSTATGLSNGVVNNTVNTSGSHACRFLGFSTRPDNDPASANQYGLFAFANHQFRLITGV